MLLRFRVGNFRSVWQPQELSLVASKLDDDASGLIEGPAASGARLVPAAVLYGANASGKSTMIDALRWMGRSVRDSQNRWKPDEGTPRWPFALAPEAADALSECDIDFVADNVRYHYGFTTSGAAFEREWLYAYPTSRRQMMFERTGQNFEFGRNLKGRNALISEVTRKNSLFLSAAIQHGHHDLSRVARIFLKLSETWHLSGHGTFLDNRVISFLEEAATGIISFRFTEDDTPEEQAKPVMELKKAVANLIKSTGVDTSSWINETKSPILEFGHKASDGGTADFNFFQESSGTQRLVNLLSDAFKALDEGGILIVDELCSSLHTQACEAVLALFSRPETNPKGAQLIATTHDTNLLRSPLLRRDQIWFIEKDGEGASHLYPLTDFRIRKGDNLEKGYLQGRFGAVPFSGPLPRVVAES